MPGEKSPGLCFRARPSGRAQACPERRRGKGQLEAPSGVRAAFPLRRFLYGKGQLRTGARGLDSKVVQSRPVEAAGPSWPSSPSAATRYS